MAFSRIETFNYRNLKDGAMETGASFIFLVGENGQGKTNILDGIYTLCYGNSFRDANDRNAARTGGKNWALKGETTYPGLEGLGKNEMRNTYTVKWENGIKLIKENDKAITDRKNLVEKNPAIVFCHDDIDFAYGEPERRRFFFDQTAGLVSPTYIDSLRNYKKVLKMRNVALREKISSLLDVLDIQLISYGKVLSEQRKVLIEAFNDTFSKRYEEVSLSGNRIFIEYKPSWIETDADSLRIRLLESREREMIMGMGTSGPHRDRYVFMDETGDYSIRASTGQRRLIALTLRIAQAEFYHEKTGRLPLLLLDDVLLELDQEKRKRFMRNLPESEQAFFTFLPDEPYRDYITGDTVVYWIYDGRFTDSQGF